MEQLCLALQGMAWCFDQIAAWQGLGSVMLLHAALLAGIFNLSDNH